MSPAHFARPPFFVRELKDPAVHQITTTLRVP